MIPVKDIIPPQQRPVVTITLIAVTALVFLYQFASGTTLTLTASLGLVPSDIDAMRVLPSLFVHSGLLHAGAVVLYLWIFGDNVEDRLGRWPFVALFFLSGLAAAVSQVLLEPRSLVPLIGAVGAVNGVLGAYFLLYPTSRILMFFPIPLTLAEVPAAAFLGLWVVLQSASTIGALAQVGAGSAHGGLTLVAQAIAFATGALLCLALRRPIRWDG